MHLYGMRICESFTLIPVGIIGTSTTLVRWVKAGGIQRKGKERQFRVTEVKALFEGPQPSVLSYECLLALSLAKCLEEGMLVIFVSKLNSSR